MTKYSFLSLLAFVLLFSACKGEKGNDGEERTKDPLEDVESAIHLVFEESLDLNSKEIQLVRPTMQNQLKPLGKVKITDNKALFLNDSKQLELLYVKFEDSLNLPFIPIITDSNMIQVKADGNWGLTYNSTENQNFKRLTDYIKDNQATLVDSLGGLLDQIERISPSFAAFSVLVSLQLSPDYYGKVQSIASKYNPQNQPYSAKWLSFMSLSEGAAAPDFTLTSHQGVEIALSDLRGKYVLIDFWATWCKPCMYEMPNVKAVYEEFGDKGFEIYGVSLDRNKEAWKKIIEIQNLDWVHGLDKNDKNSVAGKYMVEGIPNTYLIDPVGKIVAKNLRGPSLRAALEKYLN